MREGYMPKITHKGLVAIGWIKMASTDKLDTYYRLDADGKATYCHFLREDNLIIGMWRSEPPTEAMHGKGTESR
jgi:hypothetical protein